MKGVRAQSNFFTFITDAASPEVPGAVNGQAQRCRGSALVQIKHWAVGVLCWRRVHIFAEIRFPPEQGSLESVCPDAHGYRVLIRTSPTHTSHCLHCTFIPSKNTDNSRQKVG
ncbi:unnamed protein product [Eretmochelys imbricata]